MSQTAMHDPDQPLGCFQKAAYALLGVGLYVGCGCSSYAGMSLLMVLSRLQILVFAISFLAVGPAIVIMYVLYLRDIRVIHVKERAVSPSEKEKGKRDSFIHL